MSYLGKLALLGLLFYTAVPAQACDICGCAGGGALSLMQSDERRNQLGFIWNTTAFESRQLPSILEGANGKEALSKELFLTPAIQTRINAGEKWQFWALLPFQAVQKTEESGVSKRSGLADIWLGGSYWLMKDSLKWGVLQLSADFGLKLPSGDYNPAYVNETVSRFMLPGSGSWDQRFQVNASLARNQHRYIIQLAHVFTGSTKQGLAWGDRGQYLAEYRYQFKQAPLQLVGSWFSEWSGKDIQNQSPLPYSGFQLHQIRTGALWFAKTWSLGAFWFQPVAGNIADNRVQLTQRWTTQFTYYFENRK